MSEANTAPVQGHDSSGLLGHPRLRVLTEEIRPPRAAPDVRGQSIHFLDRECELKTLRSLLLEERVRLLTVVGPAGVGKTRLTIEVGHEVGTEFAQGVVFVDLSTVRHSVHVLMAIAEGLGFQDLESHTLLERIQAYLADQELLLILDNVEQVLPAGPALADLLAAAPGLTLLLTSREPLHLRWEQVFHVAPLPLPDPGHVPPREELAQIPSVALFLQRARAIAPDFRLTEENARAVTELVVHLDGLPLAIELAAARTALLSPQMILERLGQRLSLLRWQAQDLPERQQTLRSAIAWSYDLLSPDEQAFFRRLGVFVGGFTLDTAEAMAEQRGMNAIEGLTSLVDKSLVQVQERDLDNVHYVLLEAMRDYALEQLGETGELEETGYIHARYYLDLAEQAELVGRDQKTWFNRLEWAHENMRAALRWLLDHDEGELALRLATALAYFWEARGYIAEGRRWLDEALARAPAADPGLRARALCRLGHLLIWLADDVDRPRAVLTEALELARSLRDTVTTARSLSSLGMLGLFAGDWEQSRRYLEEARTHWEDVGDAWGIAYTVLYRGAMEVLQGHFEQAMSLLEDSLARYREIGVVPARGLAHVWLVYAAGGQDDVPRAVPHWRELHRLSLESQDRRLLYLTGAGMVWLLREQGDPEQLTNVLGAVGQLREMMGIDRGRIFYTNVVLTIAIDTLRARLGQEAFEAALAEGRSLTFQDLAALIAELLDAAAHAVPSAEGAQEQGGLTILSPREQEVLQLLADGFSNKQIAKELFIAQSTVKAHVTSLFNKLGVDTRAHAVAVAAQRGLLRPAAVHH